jgi:aldehyde dehydrogenase (NAD+)
MRVYEKLYINGQWVAPHGQGSLEAINPATEEVTVRTPKGDATDVDHAVTAARNAFEAWSQTPATERARLINAISVEMKNREKDFAECISDELGIPIHLSYDIQVEGPIAAMATFADRCKMMDAVKEVGNSLIIKEPVGVCAFINPWNYPLHQMVGKVAPALAAGCTMVVKAAGQTPSHAFILAEVMHKVGLPKGVFNLVQGSGKDIGESLAKHPEVDMVSFTGSTQVGVRIAELAAPTVKRVTQELGGKSPYIITEDADLEEAVKYGVIDVMINTGQTCTALTRMLVHEKVYDKAVEIAKRIAEELKVGDPRHDDSFVGPMSSKAQQQTVLGFIKKGIEEGARLVTGGTDMPAGVAKGAYVKPTVFADVTNDMIIGREEIFGPVLCIMKYKTIEEAVQVANDTVYGLSSGVYAGTKEKALKIARQMRAGMCFVNGGGYNYQAPFGGYKQSGNGREWGDEALHEFIEIKAIQV